MYELQEVTVNAVWKDALDHSFPPHNNREIHWGYYFGQEKQNNNYYLFLVW